MLFVHIAESPSQAGNFREEVSLELDDLHLPVEAGLDEVLQHLVLSALAVNMEQVQVPDSPSHIVKGSGGVDDLQGNLLSFLRLVVFHSEGSLAFEVSL